MRDSQTFTASALRSLISPRASTPSSDYRRTMNRKRNSRHIERIETTAGAVDVLGDMHLPDHNRLGLICSQKCPGDVILKTDDFARLVRGSGITIVSGFHSPIEKDCLPILLRGADPIVIVQAHKLSTPQLAKEWQKAIAAKRLLLLSPFGDNESPLNSPPSATGSSRQSPTKY